MITIPRTPVDFTHPTLKIIGVGGAGGNALDRIVLDGLPGAEIVAVNTDLQALSGSVAPVRVQIGQSITRGLGTGGDPEIGRNAAEGCSEELQRVVADATVVFVLAGLGGGTGSGALPVIADLAREQGAFVIVLGTLPFGFEGKRRTAQALEALDAVRGLADLVICFENDKMADIVAPNASVQDAFATADATLSQCVRAMAALVHRRGLLKVGFDEIATALRGEIRSYFGYGEASGDNRAHDALSAAFKSPLLDHGRALKQADAIVVQVVGGEDFTLNELNVLMEELNRCIFERTRLFLGTATDPQMNGKISISIFCGAAPEEAHSTSSGLAAAAPAQPAPRTEKPQPVPTAVQRGEERRRPTVAARAPEPEPEPEVEEYEEEEEQEELIHAQHTSSAPDPEEEEEEEEHEEPAPAAVAEVPRAPLPRRPLFAPMQKGRLSESPARAAATSAREKQEQMMLEPVNRGRFEKSEPTIIDGQDLDIPTFMRRTVR
jgi:cell division protein FtsZ